MDRQVFQVAIERRPSWNLFSAVFVGFVMAGSGSATLCADPIDVKVGDRLLLRVTDDEISGLVRVCTNFCCERRICFVGELDPFRQALVALRSLGGGHGLGRALAQCIADDGELVFPEVLAGLGRDGRDAIPILVRILKDATTAPESARALQACRALAGVAEGDTNAQLAIAPFLKSHDPWMRAAAAHACGRIGVPLPELLPNLHILLLDQEPRVRLSAAEAVWRLERNPKLVVGVLTEFLLNLPAMPESPSALPAHFTREALRILADIGAEAKAAREALEEFARRGDPPAQELGMETDIALLSIAGPSGEIERRITERLARTPAGLSAAVRLSDAAGPYQQAAVRAIARELSESEPSLDVIWVAGELGRNGASFVPALEHILVSKDAVRRQFAAKALGEIGAPAQQAVAKLRKIVTTDDNLCVRIQAALAVSTIERDR